MNSSFQAEIFTIFLGIMTIIKNKNNPNFSYKLFQMVSDNLAAINIIKRVLKEDFIENDLFLTRLDP